MANTVSAKLVGLTVLKKDFARMSAVNQSRLRDLVNTSALNIQRNAKREAPVDTGRLRSSIQLEFFSGGLAAEVRANVFYAAFVEFGTGKAGRASNDQELPDSYQHGDAAGVKAKPFLGPAYENEVDEFQRNLRKSVRKTVKQ